MDTRKQTTIRQEGDLAVDFIERFCRQSKGREGGQLLRLRDWQRDLIRDLLATGENGKRKHRTALIGMAKKNGKSLLGSALATYFLVADPEPGGEIFSAASAKDQAKIVFDETTKMIQASPSLSRLVKVYKTALEGPSGTVYRAIAADARTQDGINPSVCIFDEVHRQPDSELWSIVQMGMAARTQPLLIGITTAGEGPEGLCWDLYDYGKRLETGELQDESFYFKWFEPDSADAPYKDPEVWATANPGLGDFITHEAVESECKQLPEAEFRRLRLNQWPAGAGNWLPQGSWEPREKQRNLKPGEVDVVFAFDGSFSDDSTALVAATVEKKPHLMVLGHWEKPINEPTWRVDIDEVERTILDLANKWKPKELVADPFRWQRTLQMLAREIGERSVLEYPQNPSRMVPATQRFYAGVMNEDLTHDGNKALSRHIGNAQLHMSAYGGQIRKTKAGSGKKIDLAVCAIMAYDRAQTLASSKKAVKIWNLNDV